MNRPKLNFIIDIAMFVAMLGLIWTGILIWTVLPSGHGLTLWGLNKHEFGEIHTYFGVALLVLSGLHLWLHWGWFSCKLMNLIKTPYSQNIEKRKITAMIAVFVILFLVVVSLFLIKLEILRAGGYDQEHRLRQGQHTQQSNE
ncbi:MAG TPA: DUF4405 domain-containing protein [Sedimentisphaerales bacterium]|nr:DUF4405 domain-containing protein [Sedimentisphaerales bacterium]